MPRPSPSSSRAVALLAPRLALAVLLLSVSTSSRGAPAPVPLPDAAYADLQALYVDLHRNPELSQQEEKTAAKLAGRLRALGYEVTEQVGGHGVVGVLRNGKGPTVMLRTDLDALPIEEKTGLPYASTVTATSPQGAVVPVMHACGHDLHMTAWMGAATALARSKDRWKGTVVLVGQPAEETISGARAMLEAGLLERFPRPDFALALHVTAELPVGQVGFRSGPSQAAADMVDVTIFGTGGHGARPQQTVDPIVIAARTVLALQTIVSREVNPLDPAVVTVGSIHGGTKHNVIPDEVKLQLTVRSFKPEVQQRILEAIARIAKAEAAAARAPKEPSVVVDSGQASPPVVNDPKVVQRVVAALGRALGPGALVEREPQTGSEDFAYYGKAGVPAFMFALGTAPPDALAKARAGGPAVPNIHSARYAPDRDPSIRTGATALALSAMELLGKP